MKNENLNQLRKGVKICLQFFSVNFTNILQAAFSPIFFSQKKYKPKF